MKCTSGRAIPEIDLLRDEPCGETLVLLGNAPVCPRCDLLPRQGKSE